MNYSTVNTKIEGQVFCYRPYPNYRRKKASWLTYTLVGILIALILFSIAVISRAEDGIETRWVMCKPKAQVHLRMKPEKDARKVGWLECGDSFLTDGKKRNGWIHVLDAGECDCWIYGGFVVKEEPQQVDEYYVCVARNQVACRRWVNGPRIKGKLGWLHNGSDVNVFYIAGEWAVTSRGYIKAEWLEVDPK